MPTFVYVWEDGSEFAARSTYRLNDTLESLQKKGAKILDVKVSTASEENYQYRTYLIIYSAPEPIKL